MSPKEGILHDYDLRANLTPAAQAPGRRCAVCDAEDPRYQWSDYHGEGMCTRCGCPYQLIGGSDAQRAEGRYPYLNLLDAWLPVARAYWSETGRFVCYGQMLGEEPPGLVEHFRWARDRFPALWEALAEEKEGEAS